MMILKTVIVVGWMDGWMGTSCDQGRVMERLMGKFRVNDKNTTHPEASFNPAQKHDTSIRTVLHEKWPHAQTHNQSLSFYLSLSLSLTHKASSFFPCCVFGPCPCLSLSRQFLIGENRLPKQSHMPDCNEWHSVLNPAIITSTHTHTRVQKCNALQLIHTHCSTHMSRKLFISLCSSGLKL